MRPIEIQKLLSTRLKGMRVVKVAQVLHDRATKRLGLVLTKSTGLRVRLGTVPRKSLARRALEAMRLMRRWNPPEEWREEDLKSRCRVLESIWMQLAFYDLERRRAKAIFVSEAAWGAILEARKTEEDKEQDQEIRTLEIEGCPVLRVPYLHGEVAIVG